MEKEKKKRGVKRKAAPVGAVFGRLTLLADQPDRVDTKGVVKRVVQCRCECGNVFDVLYANVQAGLTKSCGCVARSRGPSKKVQRRAARAVEAFCRATAGYVRPRRKRASTGRLRAAKPKAVKPKRNPMVPIPGSKLDEVREEMKVGKLLVLEYLPEDGYPARAQLYLCLCKCGNLCKVKAERLAYKRTKSCGCGKVRKLLWNRARIDAQLCKEEKNRVVARAWSEQLYAQYDISAYDVSNWHLSEKALQYEKDLGSTEE